MEERTHKNSNRSEKRQRKVFLIARCTQEEKAIALDYANNQRLSLGDYLRSVAIGQKPLHVVKRSSAKAEAILLLKAELNKIGSNVNQIAKIANTKQEVTPAQLQAILDALAMCYEEISKLSNS